MERIVLARRISDLEPRIRELLVTANTCLQNGIAIEKFCTEGIHHLLGFFQKWSGDDKSKTQECAYIGYDMGGFCGCYDFRTNGMVVEDVHESTGVRRTTAISHMTKFLQDFDSFEQSFYKYVDEVTEAPESKEVPLNRRKVLFRQGMSDDAFIVITDAPVSELENWCEFYNLCQEDGRGFSFDSLKKKWYVKLLHDSEVENSNEDIAVIGYDEVYELNDYLPGWSERLKKGIVDERVELEESVDNEDGTTTFYFTAPKEYLYGAYPEAEHMTISVTVSTNCVDGRDACVSVSPTKEGSDYDWFEVGMPLAEIEELLNMARKADVKADVVETITSGEVKEEVAPYYGVQIDIYDINSGEFHGEGVKDCGELEEAKSYALKVCNDLKDGKVADYLTADILKPFDGNGIIGVSVYEYDDRKKEPTLVGTYNLSEGSAFTRYDIKQDNETREWQIYDKVTKLYVYSKKSVIAILKDLERLLEEEERSNRRCLR